MALLHVLVRHVLATADPQLEKEKVGRTAHSRTQRLPSILCFSLVQSLLRAVSDAHAVSARLSASLRRISGLSVEYVAYQLTGFLCYTTFSVASPSTQTQPHTVSAIHPIRPPHSRCPARCAAYVLQTAAAESDPSVSVSVRVNDLAFTIHALLLTLVMVAQCFLYTRTRTPRLSPVHRYILFAMWVCVAFALLLASTSSIPWACVLPSCPATQLTLLSTLGYTKIAVNLVKNAPQLYLNYRRSSTLGWSVEGVMADLVGATAAFVQQSLDVWNRDDWGMMVGDLPKFLLSILSFGFDCAFMVQHFVCYVGMNREEKEEEEEEGEEEDQEEEGDGGLGKEGERMDWTEEESQAQQNGKANKKKRQKVWSSNGAFASPLLTEADAGSVNVNDRATG